MADTGVVYHDLSVLGLGRNSTRVVDLYSADTVQVVVKLGDILLKTVNGYELWDGTAAGALRVSLCDADFTGAAPTLTTPIQVITGGPVDETVLKIEGVAATLTEDQKNRLADHGIEPEYVAEAVAPGDSNPSEV
jgi:hypothetical protein